MQQANLFGNGQSLALQAQVSGLRQLVDARASSSRTSSTRRFSVSVNVFDQLRIYTEFSQTSAGGSLTFGYPLISPQLRARRSRTRSSDDSGRHVDRRRRSSARRAAVSASSSACRSRTSSTPASRRAPADASPTTRATTSSSRRRASSSRRRSSSRSKLIGSQQRVHPLPLHGALLLPGSTRVPRSVVLKLNTEAGLVTSPDPAGVPIFAALLPRRHPRRARLLPAQHRPAPAAHSRASTRTRRPSPTARTSAATSMYYQNLELEFPIIDEVSIRGVVFTDLGNAWNLEDQLSASAAPGARRSTRRPTRASAAASLFDVRTSWGFGIRWFSPLGPLRFEWGFPFTPLPYEKRERLRVHDRQLLLIGRARRGYRYWHRLNGCPSTGGAPAATQVVPPGAHAVVGAVPAALAERRGAVAEDAVGVVGAGRADLAAPGGQAEPDARGAVVHAPDRDAREAVGAPALVAARVDAGVGRDARGGGRGRAVDVRRIRDDERREVDVLRVVADVDRARPGRCTRTAPAWRRSGAGRRRRGAGGRCRPRRRSRARSPRRAEGSRRPSCTPWCSRSRGSEVSHAAGAMHAEASLASQAASAFTQTRVLLIAMQP